MAGHAQTNCSFLFMHNQSLLWWEPLASTEWIRKTSRRGRGLGCSILQVQDSHVKSKQQLEKPPKPCLAPSPVPLPSPSPPFCLCGWEVCSHCVRLSFQLLLLCSALQSITASLLLTATCQGLIPLVLSKLHKPGSCTWSLFTLGPPVPCDDSSTQVWTTTVSAASSPQYRVVSMLYH